jgi:hypothetical protein
MRGNPIQSADGLLSQGLEHGDLWKQRVADIYGGAWYVVRFSGGTEKSKSKKDPRMIYALMDVDKECGKFKNELPRFTIFYKPRRDDADGPPRKIYGNILSLRGEQLMLLIGLEDGTQYPLIVAADQEITASLQPSRFKSLVLRKVERGSFIAGYAMFIRSKKSLDEIKRSSLWKIGLLSRSELITRLNSEEPTIDTMIDDLRNVAENDGNAVLGL